MPGATQETKTQILTSNREASGDSMSADEESNSILITS